MTPPLPIPAPMLIMTTTSPTNTQPKPPRITRTVIERIVRGQVTSFIHDNPGFRKMNKAQITAGITARVAGDIWAILAPYRKKR